MSEMVERVANGMQAARGRMLAGPHSERLRSAIATGNQEVWKAIAHAAIEAMRRPGDAAVSELINGYVASALKAGRPVAPEIHSEDMRAGLCAMIDAA